MSVSASDILSRPLSGSAHSDKVIESVHSLQKDLDRFYSGDPQKKLSHINKVLNDNNFFDEIPCRDSEKTEIMEFLRSSISNKGASEVFYIAGVPGIGKTICVKSCMEKIKKEMILKEKQDQVAQKKKKILSSGPSKKFVPANQRESSQRIDQKYASRLQQSPASKWQASSIKSEHSSGKKESSAKKAPLPRHSSSSKLSASIKKQQQLEGIIFMYENALQLQEPRSIYKSIYYKLSNGKSKDPTSAMYQLNQYFETEKSVQINRARKKGLVKVLILDELDYLQTSESDVIYTIVDWMRRKEARLIIIGISNTVDLPERFSSKISSRFGSKRLIFPQYKKEQINEILMSRLKRCNGVFSEEAVQYISTKIAQQQTDIRKCLHILRESVSKHIGSNRFNKSYEAYANDISVNTVREVVRMLCGDSFVDAFSEFPMCYKIVLKLMADYFREQTQSLAYSQLQFMCGDMIKSVNQLRAILFDLKDLGLISLRYKTMVRDQRIHQNFPISRNVEQEFITLLVTFDKVLMAFDNDESIVRTSEYNSLRLGTAMVMKPYFNPNKSISSGNKTQTKTGVKGRRKKIHQSDDDSGSEEIFNDE